jgi:hypothetical protein
MKCIKEGCDGQFMAKGSRMSVRTGHWTRKRVCDKCGYTAKTVEVLEKEFGGEMDLLADIEKAFEKYHFNKEKAEKPEDTNKDVA